MTERTEGPKLLQTPCPEAELQSAPTLANEMHFCEQRRRMVLNNTPVVLFQLDRNGIFVLSEGRGLNSLGLRPGEVVGKSIFDLCKDYPAIADHVRRALAGETFRVTIEYADEIFDTTYAPLRDRLGEIAGVIGVSTEITEKHHLRSRQSASEAFQKRQNEALWKLTRTQILGSGDLAMSLRAITKVASETLAVARASVWFYNADRSKIRCVELYHQDRGHIADEMELCASEYPRYFEALASGRDIAADNAKEDERTNEFATNYLIPLGITSMLDAPIQYQGEMVGAVCHEHIGRPRKWTPEEESFAGSVADMVALAMEAARRARAERELRQAHEELEQRVQERTAELQRAYAELKDAEAQLIHSEKMAAIWQLVAGVAHEINNPAAYVLNNISAIGRNLEDILAYHAVCRKAEQALAQTHPEWAEEAAAVRKQHGVDEAVSEITDLLKAARGGMNRIRDLIVKLQSFSRVDLRGGQGFADLNEGIHATLLLLKPVLADHIELQLDLDELPLVECNIGHINQVFMNLLVNAAHAVDTGGIIRIESRRSCDGVEIVIADTGPGILPEIQDKIFQPFFTTKEAGKGTGLGLSISRRIVESHHGKLELMPRPGFGATFRIWLPISQTNTSKSVQKS